MEKFPIGTVVEIRPTLSMEGDLRSKIREAAPFTGKVLMPIYPGKRRVLLGRGVTIAGHSRALDGVEQHYIDVPEDSLQAWSRALHAH